MVVDELFRAIDSKDADRFSSFLAEDCEFKFGNLPPVVGMEEIRRFVAGFFDSIDSLSHTIEASWDVPDASICHGIVSYTRKDGSVLTVPFANVLKTGKDGIVEYLIFADTSALFQ